MEQVTEFYGVDISKDVFDVFTPEGKHHQFGNTVEGFRAFGEHLSSNSRCVMEATGCYHQQLAGWLFSHGHSVSVVNPLIIKRFSQMRLRIAKTDKADARIIQTYAQVEKPAAWQPPQKFVTQSMEIHGLVDLLIRQRTGLKNKLHSIKSKGGSFARTTRALNRLIKQMDEEIAELESSMEALIREHQGTMYDQLCTIPGAFYFLFLHFFFKSAVYSSVNCCAPSSFALS